MTKSDQPTRSWFSVRKLIALLLIAAVFCLAPLVYSRRHSQKLLESIHSQGGEVKFGHGWCVNGVCYSTTPEIDNLLGRIVSISLPGSQEFQVDDTFIESLGYQPHLCYLTLGNIQNPTTITNKGLKSLTRFPLVSLEMAGGAITDSGVRVLGNISTLKHLELYDLKFTGEEFQNAPVLKNLNILGISGSEITDKGLAILTKAPLHSLGITGGAITDSGFNVLANQPDLKVLVLKDVEFTGEKFHSASDLKKLIHLNLAGSKVTGTGLENLSEIPNLEFLDLSQTCITSDGLRHLSNMKKLAYLSFNNSEIDADALKHLIDVETLTHLYLTGTTINNDHLHQIANLKYLTYLDLNDTQITDEGLIPLAKMEYLDRLILANTKITDKAKGSLLQIPQLKVVSVYGTKVSAATIESLRNAGIEVYTDKPEYISH